tara:strand:+ start:8490 stop:8693 length:204 start_codon:yes stop_codon:yes gene_type:complete
MKINELIDIKIYTTNEEQKLLDQLDGPSYISLFNERDQFILNNMIKKSLVSKIAKNGTYLVVKNDYK